MRACKQCGEIRPMDQYRKYYGNRGGHYKVCLLCEKVNSRYKYLLRKAEPTERDQDEIAGIEEFYSLLRENGLHPPKTRAAEDQVMSIIGDLAAKVKERAEAPAANEETEVPEELTHWLTVSLQGENPEELQDTADRLWQTYRPQTGVDQVDNYKPIYDDTYREILLKIQERIDTYEEEFYDSL